MRIGIVAGEASGDLLAAQLMRALAAVRSDLEFIGICGPRMQAEGAHTLYPMEKLSVRGYLEVVRHLPELLRIRRDLGRAFLADPPQLFIGVDAPDFNLGLAATLKAGGIPTVQYVAPAVWAWRPERVHDMGRCVSHVLSIFPCEPALFAAGGVPATYVGHPVADLLPMVPDRRAARQRLGLDPDVPWIALLPGSRASEMHYHADLFVAAAHAVRARMPAARFIAPLGDAACRDAFVRALTRAPGLPVQVLDGRAHDALEAAHGALVKSGTSSLEAALCKCAMVITYRISGLSAMMIRRRQRLPYLGLPNIIAEEFVVPELLQEDATPENLAQALVNQMRDADVCARVTDRLTRIHRLLRQDSARGIAQALAPMLGQAPA